MSLVLSPDYTEKLYDDIVEACLKNEKIVRIVESVYQKTKETPLFIRHINASKTEETKHFNLLFRNDRHSRRNIHDIQLAKISRHINGV